MKKIALIAGILVVALGFWAYFYNGHHDRGDARSDVPTGITTVVILHTNDMHAHIDNYGKLAAIVEKTRAGNKHVFLVCAGDIFSGNPVVDQFPEKGFPMIDLMNQVGYQLMEIGNHAFDYGQDVLAKRMSQAHFPFICANISMEKPPLPQLKSYYIWKTGELKIAFLGLLQTSSNNLPSANPDKIKNLVFSRALDVAGKYAYLKKDNDAVIALTHLGLETDRKLVEKYPFFDAVVGGHSHTVIKNPKEVNDALVTQAGDYLRYVGKLTLTFNGHELVSKKDVLISLDDYPETDEKIEAAIKKYNDNKTLNQVIGEAGATISGKDELGSMFTDAIRASGPFDFAFQNNGGIRIREIAKGPITVKKVYEMDPFGNEIVSLNMNYKELKSLVEYGFKTYNRPELQISGGTYTVALDPSGHFKDVVIKDNSGNILQPGKQYRIALSNYIVSAYKFDHRDPGKSLHAPTAEAIVNFIKQKQKLDYSRAKRVFVQREGV